MAGYGGEVLEVDDLGRPTRVMSAHAEDLLRLRARLMRGELTDSEARLLIEIAEAADTLLTNDAHGMGLGQTVRDSEVLEGLFERLAQT